MEVERHLRSNLLDDGPKQGQSQYAPWSWYDTDKPIKAYHFCVSSRFANKAQADELVRQIKGVFADLSARAGLKHLKAISVEVWSWDRIEPLVLRDTALRLRWFGANVASGIQEFSHLSGRPRVGFQEYLFGETKLKYVSLSEALKPSAVLETLARTALESVVLHGRGGVGKSRLLVEVGREASRNGWAVFFVQPQLAAPTSIATILNASADVPVLLLMDYVERCVSWEAWLATLNDLNAGGAKVKLIGTCRQTWVDRLDPYQTEKIQVPDKSPSAVLQILEQRPALAELAPKCAGVPVFAALMCLLWDTEQRSALESLRTQPDFGRWLQEHVARWPGMQMGEQFDAGASLVQLLCGLPCSDAALQRVEREHPAVATYRSNLHRDGWLVFDSSAPEHECWTTVHDVLADGALLRWVGTSGASVSETSIRRWLEAGRTAGTLTGWFRTLARVAREPVIQELPWARVLGAAPDNWSGWKDVILRSRLMAPLDAFSWLDAWANPESADVESAAVQYSLAEAVKELRRVPSRTSHDAIDGRMVRWLEASVHFLIGERGALYVRMPNAALVQALRWNPARFCRAAEAWLDLYADQEQAQFLLNAWLQAPRELCPVERAVGWRDTWLSLHHRRSSASFVLPKWLETGFKPHLLKQYVRGWLQVEQNSTSVASAYVIGAWLKSTKDTDLVAESVSAWLSRPERAGAPEAAYVLSGWISAGGDMSAIAEKVLAWLRTGENLCSEFGQYLLQAWLERGLDRTEIEPQLLKWWGVHKNRESAVVPYLMRAWSAAGGDVQFIKDALINWLCAGQNALSQHAAIMFATWLSIGGDPRATESYCKVWLMADEHAINEYSGYLYRAYGDRLKHLPDWMIPSACAWVRCSQSNPDAAYPLKYVAGIRNLDLQTLDAILNWCFRHGTHEDSLSRLARLRMEDFVRVEDRAALISGVLCLLEKNLFSREASPTPAGILSASYCIASLFALPFRTGDERSAGSQIAPFACRTIALLTTIGAPRTENLSPAWMGRIASADWERMLNVALHEGVPWTAELKRGFEIWAALLMPWIENDRQHAALQRLSQRSEDVKLLG